MEEVDGRLAVTDLDTAGHWFVRFWIGDFHSSPVEEQAAHAAEEYAAEWGPQQTPATVPAFPVLGERNVESGGPCTPERKG